MAHDRQLHRCKSCGERVDSKLLLTGRLADHVLKGYQMELFNLEVSEWSINLTTYFGDVFLPHRTWLLALGVIVILRVAKLIRKKVS